VAYDPPQIDRREAAEIKTALVSELAGLRERNPAWEEFDPASGLSGAMIGIFGRLAEIVIRRLNGVPEDRKSVV